MGRAGVWLDGRLTPTWRPARAHPFYVDTEADRIAAEVWASDPRPDRIVVTFGARSVLVGVPRVESPELFRAMVRDALFRLAEGEV